jgi:hypothetical protein
MNIQGIEQGTKIELMLQGSMTFTGTFVEWVDGGVVFQDNSDRATVYVPAWRVWSVAVAESQANR